MERTDVSPRMKTLIKSMFVKKTGMPETEITDVIKKHSLYYIKSVNTSFLQGGYSMEDIIEYLIEEGYIDIFPSSFF